MAYTLALMLSGAWHGSGAVHLSAITAISVTLEPSGEAQAVFYLWKLAAFPVRESFGRGLDVRRVLARWNASGNAPIDDRSGQSQASGQICVGGSGNR